MSEIIVLGASNAIPTPQGETTHLAICTGEKIVLVDCGTNPLVRLEHARLDFQAISDLILTHVHPDHIGGLPLFLMDMWLLGRQTPLVIHGLAYTLERVEQMLDLFDWRTWPNFFPVEFHRLPEEEMTVLLESDSLRVYAAPVRHILPNIGLRFEFKRENKSAAYSCDTEPCPAVIRLAQNTDVLLHEATGNFRGHTSAAQAGEVATQAKAKQLYLVHHPTGKFLQNDPSEEARTTFAGPVILAHDMMRITL
ncbi:MAG: MBL fold metallo-hydrolase [Anaerolineae bacterium]|nr:MAG: MBL fold metallo-hydrolase [Anaerolineae bacterium]